MLKIITARLEASVRLEDTVARLGGDEFVVLISGLEGSREQVESKVRDLFRDPLSVRELDGFDAVVLDPPRAGAKAQA